MLKVCVTFKAVPPAASCLQSEPKTSESPHDVEDVMLRPSAKDTMPKWLQGLAPGGFDVSRNEDPGETRSGLVLLRPMVGPFFDPLQFVYQPRLGVEDAVLRLILYRAYSYLGKPVSTVRVIFFSVMRV